MSTPTVVARATGLVVPNKVIATATASSKKFDAPIIPAGAAISCDIPKRINDLQDYISQQTTYLTEFDEALVRRWIKQITLWDDRITVELKSGISVDVDA